MVFFLLSQLLLAFGAIQIKLNWMNSFMLYVNISCASELFCWESKLPMCFSSFLLCAAQCSSALKTTVSKKKKVLTTFYFQMSVSDLIWENCQVSPLTMKMSGLFFPTSWFCSYRKEATNFTSCLIERSTAVCFLLKCISLYYNCIV